MQNEYIEQKSQSRKLFFMLILGIVLVVVGFLVTEDADAVILLSVGAPAVRHRSRLWHQVQ